MSEITTDEWAAARRGRGDGEYRPGWVERTLLAFFAVLLFAIVVGIMKFLLLFGITNMESGVGILVVSILCILDFHANAYYRNNKEVLEMYKRILAAIRERNRSQPPSHLQEAD
jgi:predicted membrane chloride channel (bestrophin family)